MWQVNVTSNAVINTIPNAMYQKDTLGSWLNYCIEIYNNICSTQY